MGETNEAVNNVLLKLVEVGVDGSGLLRVTAPGRPAPEQLTEVSFDHKYRCVRASFTVRLFLR